jgi:DNA mismatch repair protein MutS
MMLQYKKLKQNNRDSILFFRLGDFYEMFEQDAREVSKLLNLTLTQRNGVPMCGIPYHAASNYIARLIRAGKKIAVCEQTRLALPGKGIAEREIVEVITPGTLVDEGLLEGNINNYLVSIAGRRGAVSFSYIDLSTAAFYTTHFEAAESEDTLKKEFYRLSPREIIIQESLLEENGRLALLLGEREGMVINRYPDWYYDPELNREKLCTQLGVANLKGFGLGDDAPEILSAGILLSYIEDTAKHMLPHIRDIRVYSEQSYVGLDESTQKNLELVRNLQDGSKRYTLLEVLDHTGTSMGARMLRSWILSPLKDAASITERQEVTALFYHDQLLLAGLTELLSRILDIERLSTRVALDKAHAKDLTALGGSLEQALAVNDLLESHKQPGIMPLTSAEYEAVRDLADLIARSIKDEPSIQLNEGNMIRAGFNPEVDRLRGLKKNTQEVLSAYLKEEKEKTGISSLKLRFNRIIGYYLEVTKPNLHLVPATYIRRQSLVGGDRFTTETLIDKETEINNASEKIIELEKSIFLEIRAGVKNQLDLLFKVGAGLARIDVLHAFAHAATVNGYARPLVAQGGITSIEEGRHPVVETHLPGGSFIPNSISLDPEQGFFILLTGPNMAGKSTYLRQTALIILMAQIGSFVPAREARIGIVDRIFCRVGASDNLARGESTFLVEMNETANILRAATRDSLIIMDEVGRGTGTNDGLAIAWAVTLYILERIRARTLFATHFHELTRIVHSRLRNFSLEVLEKAGEIIFLKRVIPGAADSSYGIHVAKLAGLPAEVVAGAAEIMQNIGKQGGPAAGPFPVTPQPQQSQPSLFPVSELIIEQIKTLGVNNLTPLEALTLLAGWKRELTAEE